MPVLQTKDLSIYYEVHGHGEPLLLVCGLMGDCSHYWHGVLSELSKQFQVIVFDNRGSGKSGKPEHPYTIPMMVEDVMALISHLGLKKPHLLGQSMGSLIVQEMLHLHSEAFGKVVLCNTFSEVPERTRYVFLSILSLLEQGISSETVLWSFAPWVFSSEFLRDMRHIERLKRFYKSYQIDKEGLKRQLEAVHHYKHSTKEIQNKALIIASEDDVLIPHYESSLVAKHLYDVKYVVIGGGHASLIENPKAILETSISFLK